MFDFSKQSKKQSKRHDWKTSFAKSAERRRRENTETTKEVENLKHIMFKIEQALNIKQ